MTVKQFRRKAEIARECGEALLPGGCILVCHCPGDWSLIAPDGNVIDTAWTPDVFEHICD